MLYAEYLKPSEFIDDKYQLERKLPGGAGGIIWLAMDFANLRRCIVKFPKYGLAKNEGNSWVEEAWRKAFAREAEAIRIASSNSSPNVVTFYDWDPNLSLIAMEYLEGQTLSDIMYGLDLSEKKNIAVELCKGLQHIHDVDVIHCDIKPSNIIVTNNRVAIIDFGLAKLPNGEHITSGRLIGTPRYMAPEWGGISRNFDMKLSDQYSLGCTLYELFVGEVPFPGDGAREVILKHTKSTPPCPSSVNNSLPDCLNDFLLKSLSKNPDKRYRSASEMAEALVKIDF